MTSDTPFKPKILIVDDRVENLVVLEKVLDDPNFKIVRATRGEEALELTQVDEFACILLDVNMPEMDGYEVARAIRKNEKTKQLPILFVTAAMRDEGSLIEAYVLGAVDFLYKPLVPEIVIAKVAVFVELFKKRKLLEQKAKELDESNQILEKRVQERTKTLRTLVEAGFDGIIVFDKKGQIINANEQLASMLETPVKDMMDKSIFNFIPQQDHYFMRESLELNYVPLVERELKKIDGSSFPVQMEARTTTIEDQEVVVATFRDLTESKSKDKALRITSSRLDMALSAARMVVWEADLLTRKMNTFGAVKEVFGLEKNDRMDSFEALLKRIYPDDRNKIQKFHEEMTKGKGTGDIEFRITLPNGKIGWLAARVTVVCDQNRRPASSIGVGMDITARKELEEQFRHAQKMESIGRLAGGVAHDFNNNLEVIIMASNMILEDLGPDNDSLRKQTGLILKAAEQSSRLTRHLLAFSRKQVLQSIVLNLNDIIGQSHKLLEKLLEKNIEIKFIPKNDLWKVKADLSQIEQVIFNLVINAKDAIPKGGKITIQTDNVELTTGHSDKQLHLKPGQYARVSIQDTGTGMDQETLDKIFEPFFTTKEMGRGTGLGLSMVQGIIQQSGGDILVRSKKDEGTTFEIFLPSTTEKKTDLTVEKEMGWENLQGTETVLLVEDEALVREVMETVLQRSGYKVLSAKSGVDALSQLRVHKEKIDLMVTDLVMPGMSGVDLGKKALQDLPDLKIIYMSGYPENMFVHQGIVVSDAAYLQKPITPLTFLRAVRDKLNTNLTVQRSQVVEFKRR